VLRLKNVASETRIFRQWHLGVAGLFPQFGCSFEYPRHLYYIYYYIYLLPRRLPPLCSSGARFSYRPSHLEIAILNGSTFIIGKVVQVDVASTFQVEIDVVVRLGFEANAVL